MIGFLANHPKSPVTAIVKARMRVYDRGTGAHVWEHKITGTAAQLIVFCNQMMVRAGCEVNLWVELDEKGAEKLVSFNFNRRREVGDNQYLDEGFKALTDIIEEIMCNETA